jgi:hypothetical protein
MTRQASPVDGGPAFPVPDSSMPIPCEGMTLRDYFAAKAMQAGHGFNPFVVDAKAIRATHPQLADDMIARYGLHETSA